MLRISDSRAPADEPWNISSTRNDSLHVSSIHRAGATPLNMNESQPVISSFQKTDPAASQSRNRSDHFPHVPSNLSGWASAIHNKSTATQLTVNDANSSTLTIVPSASCSNCSISSIEGIVTASANLSSPQPTWRPGECSSRYLGCDMFDPECSTHNPVYLPPASPEEIESAFAADGQWPKLGCPTSYPSNYAAAPRTFTDQCEELYTKQNRISELVVADPCLVDYCSYSRISRAFTYTNPDCEWYTEVKWENSWLHGDDGGLTMVETEYERRTYSTFKDFWYMWGGGSGAGYNGEHRGGYMTYDPPCCGQCVYTCLSLLAMKSSANACVFAGFLTASTINVHYWPDQTTVAPNIGLKNNMVSFVDEYGFTLYVQCCLGTCLG